MDPLMEKYSSLSEKLDLFSKHFSELEVSQVLELYKKFIEEIEELIAEEKSSEYADSLDTLRSQLRWQFECLTKASVYSDADAPGPSSEQVSKRSTSTDMSTKRLKRIEDTENSGEGTGLCQVVGLDSVKSVLKKSVILPLLFPNLFTGGRKPLTQILLFGPPGTGKTKLAASLAIDAQAKFYSISSADILSSWVGESEKMIKELFSHTTGGTENCIVFLDEIDSLCRKRSQRESDHMRSIKNQLLIELDKSMSNRTNGFILGATNCPWDIDPAFLRRFQRRIYVPLPERHSRLMIMKNQCEEVGLDMTDDDWSVVSEQTEGYSGSDLVSLTSMALQEPLNEVENAQNWILTQDGKWMPCLQSTFGSFPAPLSAVPPNKISVRRVRLEDFQKAIRETPKTVSQEDIEKYKQFMESK